VRGPSAPTGADCLKLTSYFGERQRVGVSSGARPSRGRFAADALVDAYGRHGLATSILLRGAEGFGAKHHLRTDVSLTLSEDLPLIAIAVDTRSRIEPIFDDVRRLTGTGLVTLEVARLLTAGSSDASIEPVELTQGPSGDSTKLTVYLGRQERVYGVPAFVAVCDLLRRRGIAGATALLGVDGTARGERERAAFFGRNANVPMMVLAVGDGRRISRVLPELGGLLRRPLLTLERVHVCKRDGELLGSPADLPAADAEGRPLWHKLMIYTSEAALHDGQPVHRAIVRGLRAAGAAGATTLRGLWGFHGDHEPHGDKLLQLGRRVPALTTVIGTPEQIAAAFGIVDELTAEQGLVSCETVATVAQVRSSA
jgi:PII-like signaling protein